jgi:hypothetical protein
MPNLVPGAWVFSCAVSGCYENSKLIMQNGLCWRGGGFIVAESSYPSVPFNIAEHQREDKVNLAFV